MNSVELLKYCTGRWEEIFDRFCDRQDLIEAVNQLRPSKDPAEDDIPTGIELIMAVTGWTLCETERELERFLVPDKCAHEASSRVAFQGKHTSWPVDVTRSNGPLRSTLRVIWSEALPMGHIAAEPLRRYFGERGLGGIEAHAPNVRCHPALGYYERNEHGQGARRANLPAMLAPLTHEDSGDDLIGLYGTYLTATGQKAAVRYPETVVMAREVDSAAGAAVRLFPGEQTLGLAVGLETACAVKLGSGMPTWAARSWSQLNDVKLPPLVHQVFGWVDGGHSSPAPALDDAERLIARLCDEGKDAYVVRPHPSLTGRKVHWLDVYRERGVAGFPPLTRLLRPLPTALRLTREE